MESPMLWLIVLDGQRGLFRILPIERGADGELLKQRLVADISRLPCRYPADFPEHLKEDGSEISPPGGEPHLYALAVKKTMPEAQALAARYLRAFPDPRTPLPAWASTRLREIALDLPEAP